MKISAFFSDTLRAPVTNNMWSWGAVDSAGRLFLRVWQHEIRGNRAMLLQSPRRRKSQGYPERKAHIAQMERGAEAFGIVCIAADPETRGVRKIKSFDSTSLLRLGKLTTVNGITYAHINGRISVEEAVRERGSEGTLDEDLQRIRQRQDISPTMKDALVLARVGQGKFRTDVLRYWDDRCAVTGATTKHAIRASHIKAWRLSTDKERLDSQNGLPLIANLDALFDVGLISFDDRGRILVSSNLSDSERTILGVESASLRKSPTPRIAQYLQHHRNQHGFE